MKKQMFVITFMFIFSFSSAMDRENMYPPYCYQPPEQSIEQHFVEHSDRNYLENSWSGTFYDLYLMNANLKENPESDMNPMVRALTLSAEIVGQRVEDYASNPEPSIITKQSKSNYSPTIYNVRSILVSSSEAPFPE